MRAARAAFRVTTRHRMLALKGSGISAFGAAAQCILENESAGSSVDEL
jgi:hypothetical protein